MVKRVMFVFILELLNREGHLAFFDLQKGGRKANNAQKEKRRLARKRSRAAKREWEREAAKVAKLPPRERECLTCGCKFQSRKTAKRHKCARHSKVVRKKEEAAEAPSSHPEPPAKLITPAALITPPAPPAPASRPSHSNVVPPVTGDLGEPSSFSVPNVMDRHSGLPAREIVRRLQQIRGAFMTMTECGQQGSPRWVEYQRHYFTLTGFAWDDNTEELGEGDDSPTEDGT